MNLNSIIPLMVACEVKNTKIVVETDLFRQQAWFSHLKRISRRWALITDEIVSPLYGRDLANRLKEDGLEISMFTIPAGENSKTAIWKEKIEEQMIAEGFGRDHAIIALGGGVVTDMAGFIAATFCRGIPFIAIPTTLMGMVDASIGGKVGINSPQGKNLIGAFYQPEWTFIDPGLLTTLPLPETLNGWSEIMKYALVASPSLFTKLTQPKSNTSCCWGIDENLIRQCCAIKCEVVTQDPFEKGIRRVLNFGHTIAHAIEAASHYQISHGCAVALGIWGEAFLSFQLGFLPYERLHAIHTLLELYHLPLALPSSLKVEACLEAMRRDKKAISSQPRVVLLEEIGRVVPFEGAYCCPVSESDLKAAFDWIREPQCLD